jgi:GT2 family glycosyltransferase
VTSVPSPLAIVPALPREDADLDSVLRCLVSLQASAPAAGVLVVAQQDSDPKLAGMLAIAAQELGGAFAEAREPGVAAAVNVGLRAVRDAGCDAVIVDPAIELVQPGWLERLLARTDTAGRPAAVAGARLVDPKGLLQHAGYCFSMFSREWYLRHLNGPADLPAALIPVAAPVSGRLQLIRAACLRQVGLYDAEFDAYADLDYCLRVFGAGLECVYEPSAVACWTGAGDPHVAGIPERVGKKSLLRLRNHHRNTDFSPWVAAIL